MFEFNSWQDGMVHLKRSRRSLPHLKKKEELQMALTGKGTSELESDTVAYWKQKHRSLKQDYIIELKNIKATFSQPFIKEYFKRSTAAIDEKIAEVRADKLCNLDKRIGG